MRIPKNLKPRSIQYNNVIELVYSRARDFLKNPIHYHYTDHSIDHSVRVITKISAILAESRLTLSEDEKFVLICATLLHDIGMQASSLVAKNDMSDEDWLEEIRIRHNDLSYTLIMNSIDTSIEHYTFGLETQIELVEHIAIVAKYHRKYNLNELNDVYWNDGSIRISTLAALLRLADCLDIDNRRVDIKKLIATEIPLKSKLFWYCHQYVAGMDITKQRITVFFKFPEVYKNKEPYQQVVIDYIQNGICDQINQVSELLDAQGLRLINKIKIGSPTFSKTEEPMPNEVELYVNALGKDKIVHSEEVFDIFPTRNFCINDILDNRLMKDDIQLLVFFGGISSRLCSEDDITKINNWLSTNVQACLYICYEYNEALEIRASTIDAKTIPEGILPADPLVRHKTKLNNILESKNLYSKEVIDRVHFLPLSVPLNTYPIMVDEDIYCNILTEVRSSESTTARMRNNSIGVKTKVELLNYMRFILRKNGHTDGMQSLIEQICKVSSKLPNVVYTEGRY